MAAGNLVTKTTTNEVDATQVQVKPDAFIDLARRAVEQSSKIKAATIMKLLKAKGAVVQQRTEMRIGSTLRASDVAALTGVSRSAVQKAKTAGKVFAFRSPGIRHDLFPVLQFKGAEVRDWVEPLLAATGQGSAALHFLTVNRHSLDGRSYAEILRKTPRNSKVITAMLAQASRIGNPGA